MASAIVQVPIEHQPMIHEIDTRAQAEPEGVTLLELIEAVSEVSDNEQEVVATVRYMLSSGRVKLAGNFRDVPVARLCG
jgi:hypothetical protein